VLNSEILRFAQDDRSEREEYRSPSGVDGARATTAASRSPSDSRWGLVNGEGSIAARKRLAARATGGLLGDAFADFSYAKDERRTGECHRAQAIQERAKASQTAV